MDHVLQNDKDIEMLKQINPVRLKKKKQFPYELVRWMGRAQTSCCTNAQEKSALQWQLMEDACKVVTRKQKCTWNEFLKLLSTKLMSATVDFKSEA